LNVPAFIAGRIVFNKQQSFSRFIIRLAVAATAISVAAMILTVAFTNGFQYAIAQKIFSFSGHIRVQHFEPNRAAIAEETPMMPNDTVLRVLHANDQIQSVQPYATKNGIIRSDETMETALLKGVDRNYDFHRLDPFLQTGHWIPFADTGYSSQVNLSAAMAKELKVKANDKVIIYIIQPDGSRRARPMTVAGIYKTGIEDFDKLIAIVDLGLIRRLNNWEKNEIGGYEISLKDYRRADTVSNLLFAQLPESWNTRTTEEIFPGIFDWLKLQDTTIAIVVIIMIIVAILNLITCLIILLLERTRMVGILKAVGSPDFSIQKIFFYQGSFITLTGILLGNFLGLVFCWLQQRYGFIRLPEDAYFISKAEVKLEWWHILVIDAGTFLVCFLILMIPTLIIRKIQPARAIIFR
jgi:lipoprotein-releasing system permease protein